MSTLAQAGQALGARIARRETHLPTSEVFGPTFQGEGPYAGRVCSFVRLGLCNLACSWCDTPWTWDRSRYDLRDENPDRRVSDICDDIADMNVPLTIVTGGEPLIHQARVAFSELLIGLSAVGDIHVETNGTIPPTEHTRALVSHFSVSPKLTNNGADPRRKRIKPGALRVFADLAADERACFKFVATNPEDLDEVDHLVTENKLPHDAVWVMPEGTTTESLVTTHARLADAILARRYNTTNRLHTLMWGDVKGR